MNLFDQYGIREVADVTIYSIHKKEDGSGDVYYVPALYLDTLKVTTTEKTAENTWASGGLGNSRLISWDYGKTINLTLEDALCTPASLGLCWGGVLSSDWKDAQVRHQFGINDTDSCGGIERISRMEKAFYPRNDATSAVVSNLLPRDGQEDILVDQNGDKSYLERSSVLDGTVVRGFGYVDSHPYKWRLEIDTAVKSVAVVPDRFFSTYGKTYPIKRKQTVGINQPSESFKYEIIYLRGYDKYNDEGGEPPYAKIIYHKQAEENIVHEYTCSNDKHALSVLDDFDGFPYLKIKVCYDGSIKVYLGTVAVGWEWNQVITPDELEYNEKEAKYQIPADKEAYWVDVTDWVKTSQFEGIDLWLRFDSINALSYYLLTKYENDIFDISPKTINRGLPNNRQVYSFTETEKNEEGKPIVNTYWNIPAGEYTIEDFSDSNPFVFVRPGAGPATAPTQDEITFTELMENINSDSNKVKLKGKVTFLLKSNHKVKIHSSALDTSVKAVWYSLLEENGYVSNLDTSPTWKTEDLVLEVRGETYDNTFEAIGYVQALGYYRITAGMPPGQIYIPLLHDSDGDVTIIRDNFEFNSIDIKDVSGETVAQSVAQVVGLDYDLESPEQLDISNECVPCCKKSNLSRSIWAYVNPRTMTPYDDDYWFHQGEPYYKKSLTLSTKEQPLNAKRIMVQAGEFPGMYKIVGETFVRSRETGEDERVQLSFPLCKIKSNHTLTLSSDGDPTVFNLDVEVATPPNGIPMEITFYGVDKEMKQSCSGNMIEKDGSTRISAR